MKMRRRHFMQMGIATAATIATHAVPSNAQSENQAARKRIQRKGLSILQGTTDSTSTQFSILHERKKNLRFYVQDNKTRVIYEHQQESIQFENHPLQITKIQVSALTLGENYSLRALDLDSSVIIDDREFQTLDTSKSSLQFAICSCMDEDRASSEIWQSLFAKKPDVIVFIGDSVYADRGASSGIANAAHLWKKFCVARQTLEIYYSPKLIPVIATWDDHDFGMNNGDSEAYPFVKESQKNFQTFFAQDPGVVENVVFGPGISTAHYFGSQLFILADDRSFRLQNGSENRYAHWGKEQEEWMLGLIQSHSGPTVIFNGSQFFLDSSFTESLAGSHANQLRGFMKALSSAASRVVFASGDVHFSEISQIEDSVLGYRTFELTSSAVHSRNIPGILQIISNSARIAASASKNFLFVQMTPQGMGCEMNVKSIGSRGQIFFEKDLKT